MARDYIPSNMAAFHQWFSFLYYYVERKVTGLPPAWTHIPQKVMNELDRVFDLWVAAYEATLVPHPTTPLLIARNEARKEAEAVIRPFVRNYIHNPFVTNAEREEISVPNHDKTPTPHMSVPERVELSYEISGIRRVILHIKVEGASNKAKPTGYDGAVVVWKVREKDAPRAARPQDMGGHEMASRPTHELTFDETERGMVVDFAATWQNGRGKIGEWSAIRSAIIP